MRFDKWKRFGRGQAPITQHLDAEMEHHRRCLIEELTAEGWSPDDARREADRRLGDTGRFIAECRQIDRRHQQWLGFGGVVRDLRLGARRFFHQPLLSASIVLTLALGVGASAAMVTVLQQVLWRPLDFHQPERLAALFQTDLRHGDRTAVSPPNFFDWRDQLQSFELLAAYGDFGATLDGGAGEPERLRMAPVTDDFLEVFGIEPILGRGLERGTADDDAALISHRLWQRRFGGDPTLLGSSIRLDDEPLTVVGVLPPGFQFPAGHTDIWLRNGLPRDREMAAGSPYRAFRVMSVIGRLHDGVTIDRADAELRQLAERLAEDHPDANRDQGATAITLLDLEVGESRPALTLLGAAVAVILLLACANIANLLLVQAAGRQREIAVRTALGAGEWHLIRQLAAELLIVAAAGGLVGAWLSSGLLRWLLAVAGDALPRADSISVGGPTLLVVAALSVSSAALFGLAPLIFGRRVRQSPGLRDRSGGGRIRRIQRALVIGQVAVTVPLLIVGGLLTRSYQQLSAVDPGYTTEQVWTFGLSLGRGDGPEAWRSFWLRLVERLDAVPGVESVATALQPPILGTDVDRTPVADLAADMASHTGLQARHHLVSADYFETLGIHLLAGRDFDRRDAIDRPGTVIINEALAERLWPGRDPLGRQLGHEMQLMPDEPTERTVVGVISDIRHFDLAEAAEPQIYLPMTQSSWPQMSLIVKTSLGERELREALRHTLGELDERLAMPMLHSLSGAVEQSLGRPRFQRLLLGIFATTSLLLAALGLYGVLAYAVTQRRQEIGVRLAVGASRSAIVQLILFGGLRWVAVGLVPGVLLTVAASRWLGTQLYGIGRLDPISWGVALLLFALVAILAGALPARRALDVEPVQALRDVV